MRIMGLDMGSKRIGIALSDELLITAQGLSTLTRTTVEKDVEQILSLAAKHGVERIIVGLPKNMNGTLGDSAQEVLRFVDVIRASGSLAVELWDERLSTVAVNRTLIEADVSRQRRKKVVDKLAAVYILQSYLDRRNYSS